MMFGNARKQAADPSYQLPAKRRVIWEHGQDLAVFLSVSILVNILMALSLFVLCIVLIVIYDRPPYILAQDQGYVYWRTTEADQLRYDLVRTFCDVTTTTLYTINPGGYDLTPIVNMTSAKVIDAFQKHAAENGELTVNENHRRLWRIKEVKIDKNPPISGFITIACRGEMLDYQLTTTITGQQDAKVVSRETLLRCYLSVVPPTPINPWGLVLEGVQRYDSPDEIKDIWSGCEPIPADSSPLQSPLPPVKKKK